MQIKKKTFVIATLILTLMVIANIKLINKNIYFNNYQIKNDNQILYQGKVEPKDFKYKVQIDQNMLYHQNYVDYDFDDDINVDEIYNIFKITDLEPLLNYQANITFNFKTDDMSQGNLDVGIINYQPISQEDKKTTDNALTSELVSGSEIKTLNIIDNQFKYQSSIDFSANEDGEVWLIIGVKNLANDGLDYQISNIKINLKRKER